MGSFDDGASWYSFRPSLPVPIGSPRSHPREHVRPPWAALEEIPGCAGYSAEGVDQHVPQGDGPVGGERLAELDARAVGGHGADDEEGLLEQGREPANYQPLRADGNATREGGPVRTWAIEEPADFLQRRLPERDADAIRHGAKGFIR